MATERSIADPVASALTTARIQRCGTCRNKSADDECASCKRARLQRSAADSHGSTHFGVAADHSVSGGNGFGRVHRLPRGLAHAISRPGRGLERDTRSAMETRFQTSFADVRVHDDVTSDRAARALGAEAFACGQHIHFAAGRFQPRTHDGMYLLAHELAHTVQQRAMPTGGSTGGVEIGDTQSPQETEADSAARNAVDSGSVQTIRRAPAPAIQRNGSPEVEHINDLLSYGLFDWAITDDDAVEALTRLKALPRIVQAEFVSDSKYVERLRDNLPDPRVPELDAIINDVAGMKPASSKVDAMIDKLSYGLFDWAITDQDAEHALDILKTLSGEQLAVALKRIDYGRLMDNLPARRRQELSDLLDDALGPGGTLATSLAKEPGTALRSFDFVSDHGVMRDNTKGWSNDGKPYPQPDFVVSETGESRSAPISHTMGQPLQIDLGFDVVPVNAPAASAELVGKGTSPFLDFHFAGTLTGGKGKRIRMTSPNKLPENSVAAYMTQSVDWMIKWGTWQHPIGTTGPFDIYATIGRPRRPDTVTTKRMALAVKLVNSAPSLDPHEVVKKIMFTWTSFNLDVQYENEWDLAADMETGAQCIDLVRFVDSVIQMVDLPGVTEALQIWAYPSAPYTAIVSPWRGGGMSLVGVRPGTPPSIAVLLDGDFRPNNFEAALKFTANGITKYYPGGVQDVFDHPDEVLTVFNCLAWIAPLPGGRYVIKDVPAPYQAGLCNVGDEHRLGRE